MATGHASRIHGFRSFRLISKELKQSSHDYRAVFIQLGENPQDQAVKIYAVSGKIAGGYYVSVIPPASFQN